MKVEDADPELQQLASRVFAVAEWLTEDETAFHEGSGWYKCGKPILVWFRLNGPKARKNPVNSIVVTATKPDESANAAGTSTGNNMYGVETPEIVVRSRESDSLAGFLQFIGRAYQVWRTT